jgi:hypothetical protein
MTRERWKPVVGWEGFYEVSDRGRVRTVERAISMPQGGARLVHRRIKKSTPIQSGYHYVCLKGQGRQRRVRQVHALVLEAFVGPKPEGEETRHLDGDRSNNRLSNLCYGTRKENMADAIKHGTTNRGDRNPNVKLTAHDVDAIRLLGDEGVALADIAGAFSISFAQAGRIIRRERWAWL